MTARKAILWKMARTFAIDLSMFSAVVGYEGSEVLIILNGLRVALRG